MRREAPAVWTGDVPAGDSVRSLLADGSVVTIGVFDGVHLGHRELLSFAGRRAGDLGLPLVVVTFDPHPMAVVRPDADPPRLSTLSQRIDLLGERGADLVRILAFTGDLSQQTPVEFIESVLRDDVRARLVVVGENFRFGHRAAGSVATLREHGPGAGFATQTVRLVTSEGPGSAPGLPWSSTRIRAAIASGDVVGAATGLGRPPRVEGVVVHGDHRGRELGYPTANLDPGSVDYGGAPAIPADGVYAGWLVTADGSRHPSAVSVGTNPTFDGVRERRVEAYVLDRDDLDLYGQRVAVDFVERLRGMAAFTGVAALVAQMADDVAAARLVLR